MWSISALSSIALLVFAFFAWFAWQALVKSEYRKIKEQAELFARCPSGTPE